MDIETKRRVAAAINYFWDGQIKIDANDVTEELADTVYHELERAGACSWVMDFVPRPAAMPTLGYSVGQLANIGKRILDGNEGVYYICKKAVAISGRSAVELGVRGQ